MKNFSTNLITIFIVFVVISTAILLSMSYNPDNWEIVEEIELKNGMKKVTTCPTKEYLDKINTLFITESCKVEVF